MPRRAFACLAMLALAACEVDENGEVRGFLPGGETGSASGRGALASPDRDAEPVRRVALAGGAVVVGGPRGYCVDPATVETNGTSGFAMIASCRIIAGAGPEVAPVIVTVTVGAEEPAPLLPDPEALARLAGGPARAFPERGGLVTAQMQRGGSTVLAGGDERYWRGAFLQGQRIISLALYAPEGSELAGDRGLAFLGDVRDVIRSASPGAGRG
ncbi:dihydroxy-acid dehydratase [Roseivivax halodurans JCM 10272]|uniref:Dihydroxy-acid dehydratase n=1 Tax=Roseivivax halodurans JCM 10272 TaxID=1449350 RepID=X7EIP2_9RHOB|nr:hypothetical protein [Roseivivax halodurans]ETX15755.1 dihydroxy-acid dehydratase [Roseivivax halodurans JCM 10272]